MVDSSQAVENSYSYEAFGQATVGQSDVANPYLFVGGYGVQWESTPSLYFMQARYYSPGVGRFISEDPYGGSPQDPLSLHRYLYCANGPVSRTDPTGMWEWINPFKHVTFWVELVLSGGVSVFVGVKLGVVAAIISGVLVSGVVAIAGSLLVCVAEENMTRVREDWGQVCKGYPEGWKAKCCDAYHKKCMDENVYSDIACNQALANCLLAFAGD